MGSLRGTGAAGSRRRARIVVRNARRLGAVSAAALLAACTAPPSVDPESGIARAVGDEYRRFIEEAQGDMGLRSVTPDGQVTPLSQAAPRPADALPVTPPQVEALPVAAGGYLDLWQSRMLEPRFAATRTASFEVDDLVNRMLARSNQIAAFSDLPLIRDTQVRSTWATFDPIVFAEIEADSFERQRSSALDTGTSPDAPSRLEEDGYTARFGLRQRLITGGEVEASQAFGTRSSNSEFFIPDPQSDAEWRVELTQPLLEGFGAEVNLAPTQIATLERDQSVAEFQRQVETQLIEVIRAYWTLYEERGRVILRDRLVRNLGSVAGTLAERQSFDALPSETAQASAALQRARASIVRAETGVRNSEARLASLLSDPSIFGEQVEVIPAQPPVRAFSDIPLEDVSRLALENRPELRAAALQLRAAEVRQVVAANRLLPDLDAFAAVYNGGLTDGANIPGAVARQTGQTRLDYIVGLRLEVPLGNREDQAIYDRRRLEVRQLTSQLRNVVDTVLLESQIAVREARASYEELRAREVELRALDAQAATLGQRYAQGLEAGSAFLNAYLSSLEQQSLAQEQLLQATVAYNLALYTLERVAGTMLESRGIGATRVESDNLDYITIVRGAPGAPGGGLGGDIFSDPEAAAEARARPEDEAGVPGG
ncbi:MAG: TolC family protein [Pseudomonadota bacterium]